MSVGFLPVGGEAKLIETESKTEYETLQKLVEGYIELIKLNDYPFDMYVNEEGFLMPRNTRACKLAGIKLCGPAVCIGKGEGAQLDKKGKEAFQKLFCTK
jgi:hypothetical protein